MLLKSNENIVQMKESFGQNTNRCKCRGVVGNIHISTPISTVIWGCKSLSVFGNHPMSHIIYKTTYGLWSTWNYHTKSCRNQINNIQKLYTSGYLSIISKLMRIEEFVER